MSDSERKVVHVGEESWHYKIYQYTISHRGSKKKPGYRENLCHYMRAVLIWAPLLWFFVVPIDKGNKYLGWVRIWMIIALWNILDLAWEWRSDIIYGLGVAVEEVWLLTIAILGVVALVVLGFYLGDKYQAQIEQFISWVSPYTRRLWENVLRPPLVYMWLGIKLTWRLLTAELFGQYYLRTWMLMPFLAVGIGWWFDDDATKHVLIEVGEFILFVGFILLVFSIFAAVVIGVYKLLKLLVYRSVERSERTVKKGTSAPQIAWTYLTAKKAKICPFIVLPEGRTQPALQEE